MPARSAVLSDACRSGVEGTGRARQASDQTICNLINSLRSVILPLYCGFVDRADDAESEAIVDEKFARELLDVVGGDHVDAPFDFFGAYVAAERELVASEPDHAARGRLERQGETAFDVFFGELKLVVA